MRVWVVLALLAMGLGCSEEPPEQPQATTTVAPTTTTHAPATTRATTTTVASYGSARNPFPVGQNVKIDGGWSLKVLKAAEVLSRADAGRPVGPVDALVVVVDLEMSYMGQGESFAMKALGNLKAVGASSRLYPYYRGHCTDNLLWQLQLVLAEGQVTGQICFVIDDSDADSLVMFLDASYDQDDRAFFSLR